MPSEIVTAWSDGESGRFETVFVGMRGSSGIPGEDGESAYEIAVRHGFVGTEEEWLASLVGDIDEAALALKANRAGDPSHADEDTFPGPGLVSFPTADPVEDSTVGANTSWVRDHVANSLDGANPKNPVRFLVDNAAASLATAFENGDIYDGLTLATGDRFLRQIVTAGASVTDTLNGIYVVQASGAAVRGTDADTGAELKNAMTTILAGTYADTNWTQDNTVPTVGAAAPAGNIIFFRRGTGGGGTAAVSGDFTGTKSDLTASTTGHAYMRTLGDSNYFDAGSLDWKKVGTPDLTIPAYFRRTDAGVPPNNYEAVTKRTIHGETIGIFGAGSGVDIGPALEDVFAWLHGKGGGRIILPPGVCSVNSTISIVGSGLWLQGTAVGDSTFNNGTQLRCATGATIQIGGDVAPGVGGVEQYWNKFSDMAVLTATGSTNYMFQSRKLRGLIFENIFVRNVHGFLNAGDLTVGNQTKQVFFHNIEGGLAAAFPGSPGPPVVPAIPGHFIFGRQFGAFWMSNVSIAGAATSTATVSGSSFINIPATAVASPDGVTITNCATEDFDVALSIRGGAGNWFVSNTWFDGCKTTGIDLRGVGTITGIRFSNVHIAGIPLAGGAIATSVGLLMGTTAGAVSRCAFNDGEIIHMGGQAVQIGANADNISIQDNQFVDNAWFTDSARDVVEIQAGADNICVEGNQIYKKDTVPYPGQPRYGVNVASAEANIAVRDNMIQDIGGAFHVNNTFRSGSLKTRKIYGNSGQVLEGQAVVFGPWSRLNVGSTGVLPYVNVDLDLGGAGPDATLHRRGRLVGIAARGSAVTGSSMTFTATLDGVNTALTCIASAGAAFASAENLDGILMNANQQFGVHISTSGTPSPTTTDWAVFLTVVYD